MLFVTFLLIHEVYYEENNAAAIMRNCLQLETETDSQIYACYKKYWGIKTPYWCWVIPQISTQIPEN